MDWPRSCSNAATVELSTPPLIATAMAVDGGAGASRGISSSVVGGMESFRILPGLWPGGYFARGVRRKSAQAFCDSWQYADRFVDFRSRSKPAQADAHARSRLVIRKPNRLQHVRRLHCAG